jgi:aspartyl-tRNA(Asn)/glutamyl-tRNA(Gln) amidotransferase subunit A
MSDVSTASELLVAYRDRRLSPVEVLEALLPGIEADEFNAFSLVDAEGALAQARASEERWRTGTPLGALDGVPVAIKDAYPARGWPTLRGSRAIDPAGPWDEDGSAVAALRRNGAVLPVQTTSPEFGWKGVTDSPRFGITRNPWDPAMTPGGSSGGSAAALAAGLVPLALGSDGAGSIRIPCGFTGLPGFKPTFGRVPMWPASAFGTVSHGGPMARTVTDAALLLDVLCEPDPRDGSALPPPARSFLEGLDDGIAGTRIAFSPDLGYVRVDPEVAAAVERAATALAELGAHVERADPGFDDPRECQETLWAGVCAKLVADLGAPAGVHDPGFARVAAAGAAITLTDYLAAMKERDALGTRMGRFHTEWDLLITPTLPIPAFTAGRDVPEGWPDEAWQSWTPFTYPFNLTQQPAATVPCGFTVTGLPIGLQIVGPRHADALVLRVARAYETALPGRPRQAERREERGVAEPRDGGDAVDREGEHEQP